jgi:hypothetical protein
VGKKPPIVVVPIEKTSILLLTNNKTNLSVNLAGQKTENNTGISPANSTSPTPSNATNSTSQSTLQASACLSFAQ